MAPPDATPKSLFPAAATPASPVGPGGGSFGAPGNVEFPMVTESEDAVQTGFGSRIQADREQDPDLLDFRVSHVRDVQYEPGSRPMDASGVASVTAVDDEPVTPALTTHGGTRPRSFCAPLLAALSYRLRESSS